MKPPPRPEWATTIPGRSPEFKIHNQKNHATCALTACLYSWRKQGERIIWHWENDEWVKAHSETWDFVADELGRKKLKKVAES